MKIIESIVGDLEEKNRLSDEQITVRIASLLKEKENIEKEFEKLQNELLQKLCPKEKKECEPTYCIFD